MTAEIMLWLLVCQPAVVGAVLCLSGRRADRAAGAVSLLSAAGLLAAAIVVAVTGPAASTPFIAGADFALGVDGLSGLMTVTVAAATVAVLVFSLAEITHARARFHGLMLLFAAAAALTATATTLPTLLFAWEIMGALSYALIGFWWRDDARTSAGLTAFVTTRAGDLGLYLAAGAALAGGAGMALADLPEAGGGWVHVAAAGVLVAAAGKAAQLPFSFWLSRAMAGPSPVSALLHSAAMVALGAYLLLRAAPLLAAAGWADETAAWLGAVTALALGAVAFAQRDLKQLLAASTAAQLGFVVMAAGLGAITAGAGQLVAHAATKALLFLAAGAWLGAVGTTALPGLRGVARRWPVVGLSAGVAALALGGLAPLSLWATKDAVLAAAAQRSWALYTVGSAAALLSAAYASRVLVIVWQRAPRRAGEDRAGEDRTGEDRADAEQRGTGRIGVLAQAPLPVLAVGAAGLGVLALPPLSGRVQQALGRPPEEAVHAAQWTASAVGAAAAAALVAVALARRPHALPRPRWARTWLGLHRLTDALVVRPVLRLADSLARFDDRVLDRGVEAAAAAVPAAARRLAGIDDRGVDGTVAALARGAGRLGGLARRPQTGRLHDYYLQIAAILAAGAVLLLVVR